MTKDTIVVSVPPEVMDKVLRACKDLPLVPFIRNEQEREQALKLARIPESELAPDPVDWVF